MSRRPPSGLVSLKSASRRILAYDDTVNHVSEQLDYIDFPAGLALDLAVVCVDRAVRRALRVASTARLGQRFPSPPVWRAFRVKARSPAPAKPRVRGTVSTAPARMEGTLTIDTASLRNALCNGQGSRCRAAGGFGRFALKASGERGRRLVRAQPRQFELDGNVRPKRDNLFQQHQADAAQRLPPTRSISHPIFPPFRLLAAAQRDWNRPLVPT